MTGKETHKHLAVKTFHAHAEEYDKWFEDNSVYEMELTALKSLQTAMDDPKMEIDVGPGRHSCWLAKERSSIVRQLDNTCL